MNSNYLTCSSEIVVGVLMNWTSTWFPEIILEVVLVSVVIVAEDKNQL